MTNQTNTNIVSSFFFYMWNAWSREECRITFPQDHNHIWSKWCGLTIQSTFGRAEEFYKELDTLNRELLVNRACELYDGSARRCQEPVQPAYRCEECGSVKVQIQAWVNPNNDNQFISDKEDYKNSWCDSCQNHVTVVPHDEFMEDTVNYWWEQCNGEDREVVTGLYYCDFNTDQEFDDACNTIWNAKTDDQKISVWQQINHIGEPKEE